MEDLIDPESLHSKTGFKTIQLIGRLVIILIIRFWKACSIGLLLVFLLFWLYGGIATMLLLTCAFVGAFYHYQDALLYFPDQPENSRIYVQSPRLLGVPYENLHIQTRDSVSLNAIFLKQPSNRLSIAPTIVMYHGNAGNIGHRLSNAFLLYTYTGSNVFLLEYRGYGKSEGSPSEKGFELDGVASLEYLLSRPDIDHQKLILYGRSLGGAVAFNIAALEQYTNFLFAVIVENTFTSIPEISKYLFKYLKGLPEWCYKNKFLSINRVRLITTPTLFLSGLSDQLVPPNHMLKLYNTSESDMKRMETFESGTHNETWQCQGYTEAINRFLNDVYSAHQEGRLPRTEKKRRKTNDLIDI
ncbi:protein ABHD13-like [Clytia hemisphaerica]|uniref:Protein ABHD13 n=1 Tax=Clytia hemisphaerica TaxID=252671 RepID=A0A7M5USI9_9CNID|eukprot:TCONS_00057790-protein